MGVAHLRIDLQGTLCSGAEVWSCGFSTAPPAGGADADVDALALTALTVFRDNFFGVSAIYSIMPLSVAFTGTRVQQLRADGTVQATGLALETTPGTGANALALPPQNSVVVSLRTPIAGPRGRGRMYLPVLGNTHVDANGRIPTASRDAIASQMDTAMQTWNDDPGTSPVAVASNVGGFVTSVTSIQVGSIIDTQRRRRDALPESYITVGLTP